MNPQRVESSLLTDMKTTLQQRLYFDDPLQFGSPGFSIFQAMKILDGQMQHHKRGVRTPNYIKTQRRSRAPGGHCEGRLWGPTQFSLNRARLRPKWLLQKGWMLLQDSDCGGQAADAVSAYTQEKLRTLARLLKIPKSECPDGWIRLPRHKMADILLRYLLERIFFGHPLEGLLWERQFEEVLLEVGREKIPNCELSVSSSKTRIILIGIRGRRKIDGEKQNMAPMWKRSVKMWMLGNHIISWPCVFGMYSTWMQSEWNHFWRVYADDWITFFCWSYWKINRVWKNPRKNSGVVLRYGRSHEKVRCKILRIGKQKDSATIKSLKSLLGWSSFQERGTLNQLENCQKYAHKLRWHACTWHDLDDPASCGLWTSLQDQSQNGLRLATDDWQDWFRTFVTQMTSDSIVIWETRLSIVDLVCSKT